MALKATELSTGCFARAAEDEPMFVLLGRDALAPWLVLAWSWLRRCQIWIGSKPASDFERCDEAVRLAKQMRAWRRMRRIKSPVTPVPHVVWSEGAPTEVVWPQVPTECGGDL
jgi:hypothetical protein